MRQAPAPYVRDADARERQAHTCQQCASSVSRVDRAGGVCCLWAHEYGICHAGHGSRLGWFPIGTGARVLWGRCGRCGMPYGPCGSPEGRTAYRTGDRRRWAWVCCCRGDKFSHACVTALCSCGFGQRRGLDLACHTFHHAGTGFRYRNGNFSDEPCLLWCCSALVSLLRVCRMDRCAVRRLHLPRSGACDGWCMVLAAKSCGVHRVSPSRSASACETSFQRRVRHCSRTPRSQKGAPACGGGPPYAPWADPTGSATPSPCWWT